MGWHQRTIWSDVLVRRPVNGGQYRSARKSRKAKSKQNVNVYLFRIKTKGSDETFLKIGITNSIADRFEFDVVRYKFVLLGRVGCLSRKEAIRIEKRLHALFANLSYRPKNGFVSGGHTECFVDHERIIETTRSLFALVEEEKGSSGRRRTDTTSPKINDPFAENEFLSAHEARARSEKKRAVDRVVAFDMQANASAAARRRRHKKRSMKQSHLKMPSVDLLKNQSL